MPGNHNEIEKRLWDAADELRANSALKSSEYSVPRRKRGRESFLSNDESLEISVTVDDLEAALERFREIATDLGGNGPEVDKT